jgi:hypothetical protein
MTLCCAVLAEDQCKEEHAVSLLRVEVIGFNPEDGGSMFL